MQATLDFDAAQERAASGMQRAIDHANRVVPDWSTKALEALRREVRVRSADEKFTIEQLRVVVDPLIEKPADARAWGHVTQQAIKRNVIVKTNSYAPAASSNGAPKMLYVRGTAA